jgi:cell division protein FtsA
MARRRTIGVLDIGTHKVVCLVGAVPVGESAAIPLLGVGHQRSRGLKAGVVTDAAAVEGVVRAVVAQAERVAGVTLDEVTMSVTCGRLQSKSFLAHADIESRGVTEQDIARLTAGARAYAERDGRALVHMNRKAFILDGVPGGEDPRGLAAKRLSATMHAVTADDGALRNLMQAADRCHLAVTGLVAAPYASALAVTTLDERRLAVTVIDLGGGTTTAAVFRDGHLVTCEVLPTGGHHLTLDIAQSLQTPLGEAERIKVLYASLVNAQSDVCETFSFSLAGDLDGELGQATRAELAEIVRPRIESVLDAIHTRLCAAGFATGPVVFTGGASQLVGLAEFASQLMGRTVRIGRPAGLSGIVTGVDSPAFATAAGLLVVAREGQRSQPWQGSGDDDNKAGYLGRVGQWLQGQF